jgi:hypothetical protein
MAISGQAAGERVYGDTQSILRRAPIAVRSLHSAGWLQGFLFAYPAGGLLKVSRARDPLQRTEFLHERPNGTQFGGHAVVVTLLTGRRSLHALEEFPQGRAISYGIQRYMGFCRLSSQLSFCWWRFSSSIYLTVFFDRDVGGLPGSQTGSRCERGNERRNHWPTSPSLPPRCDSLAQR